MDRVLIAVVVVFVAASGISANNSKLSALFERSCEDEEENSNTIDEGWNGIDDGVDDYFICRHNGEIYQAGEKVCCHIQRRKGCIASLLPLNFFLSLTFFLLTFCPESHLPFFLSPQYNPHYLLSTPSFLLHLLS